MISSRLGRSLGDALLAWFPFLVIFVMTPVNIYFVNQLDFGYEPQILLPFLGAALLFLLAAIGLSLVQRSWLSKVVYAMFFWGLYLVFSDTFIPLHWGLMDGTEELRETSISIAIQIALAIVLGVAWYALPRPVVKSFGLPLVLVVVAWQIAILVPILAKEPIRATASAEPTSATTDQAGKLPNIYQLVLDGYSSLLFRRAAEQNNLLEELRGFTFFQNNMSNYVATDASVPSFLSGHLFKGGSFKEFQLQANVGGLRKDLQDFGYEVSIYAPDKSRFWMFSGASYVYTSKDVHIGSAMLQRLAQMTFVRVAPEILRRETLFIADFVLYGSKASFSNYKVQSVPLMERFLADETGRINGGQYVYAHLMLPHGPFIWDRDCRLSDHTSVHEQTSCATKLIKEFVRKLKQLGRYDDSLIIIQSDHGLEGIDTEPIFRIPHLKADHYDENFSLRLHSLLLIKPPASGTAPLRISEEVSQLVDIPATVYDILDLAPPPNDGHSVFALDEVNDREISVFNGPRFNFGRAFGTLFKSSHTTLGHLVYNPARGWTTRPDIGATHEGWW